ncbi:hypothetical protein ABI_19640 [Asticcacaulis biprosthecium C19]|uniref:Uncharacterized protein n=1 Tax=Asticcacaulis biprosthecium C19 TaxID=715226 RepID=F4QLM6_9CAUL|nr:hypothetical protein [Asticcacaulis biprosthecium]EGF93524.1 hypothetical protein ABI_19640 [Asticcacaulis biprosthecium C19]
MAATKRPAQHNDSVNRDQKRADQGETLRNKTGAPAILIAAPATTNAASMARLRSIPKSAPSSLKELIMRTTSPPPHKQDNGMDRTYKAMSPRMYRDNDNDRDNASETRVPTGSERDRSANAGNPPADAAAPQAEPAALGRYGAHHYSSDQDKRGYERAYQREHNNIGRFERSTHDLQKDGRQSRDD